MFQLIRRWLVLSPVRRCWLDVAHRVHNGKSWLGPTYRPRKHQLQRPEKMLSAVFPSSSDFEQNSWFSCCCSKPFVIFTSLHLERSEKWRKGITQHNYYLNFWAKILSSFFSVSFCPCMRTPSFVQPLCVFCATTVRFLDDYGKHRISSVFQLTGAMPPSFGHRIWISRTDSSSGTRTVTMEPLIQL